MKEDIAIVRKVYTQHRSKLSCKKNVDKECSCGSTLAIFNNCVICQRKVKYEYNLSWMVPGLRCGSETKIQELATNDAKALVEKKKLRLVLDLDETLIHAERITEEMESDSEDEDEMTNNEVEEEKSSCDQGAMGEGAQQSQKSATLEYSIVRIGHRQYRVWMRPYLLEFLETIKTHFDVYIYTHATKEYAETILEALNIKRLVRRICARDPKEQRKRKRLSKVLCQPNLSLIVDDKRKVWGKEDHPNVVRVAPFMGKPQDVHDQVLNTLTTILLKVHHTFFAMNDYYEQQAIMHPTYQEHALEPSDIRTILTRI